jgi:hypothetical protein
MHGGRVARAAERLACPRFDGFAKLVGRYVPRRVFDSLPQRQRVFTPWVTFCAFLTQVLQRDGGCREVVQRVQAFRVSQGEAAPSANTSAYCQARAKLGMETLRQAHGALVSRLEAKSKDHAEWQGRVVKLIDGTGFSMPDSDENRSVYPYAGGQKPGCGFPVGKLVAIFSLAGHLVRLAHQSWKTHEIGLARLLVGWINPGEVLVADRGLCGWGLIALLQRKQVDVVVRLHQARGDRPGSSVWKRPQTPETWEPELWAELPRELKVRIVRFRVAQPGFRTKTITLATTLLDEKAYPDEALIELYRLRWQIEGNYRDIKVTLGLDVLRTRTPEMIRREVLMQAIAHNLVRALMLEAARTHQAPLRRISFKGALTAMRQWAPLLHDATGKRRESLYEDLFGVIASDLLPVRPNRVEPRAVKRRPKAYQLMTKPRRLMRVSKSRTQK